MEHCPFVTLGYEAVHVPPRNSFLERPGCDHGIFDAEFGRQRGEQAVEHLDIDGG